MSEDLGDVFVHSHPQRGLGDHSGQGGRKKDEKSSTNIKDDVIEWV